MVAPIVALAGCGASSAGTIDGATRNGEGLTDLRRSNERGDPQAPADGGEGSISIYMAGDLSKTAFGDGLAGQTPSDFQIAVSRYHVLLSAADPSPQLCFDHGSSSSVASLGEGTKVGSCRTQTIKSGLYTHGRTKVDWARFTVDGTYHSAGQKIAGKLTFFRAYSDTVVSNRSFKAGQGTITFSGLSALEIPVTYPPPVSVPGILSFETINGELLVTFAFSKPLPIAQPDQHQHWARFHWKIGDAFRWADQALAGYQSGVWDVALPGAEPVMMHGVSSYYTTSSVD
jgi:hypothetical protein